MLSFFKPILKRMFYLFVLCGVLVIPYVLTTVDWQNGVGDATSQAWNKVTGWTTNLGNIFGNSGSEDSVVEDETMTSVPTATDSDTPHLDGGRINHFSEVIRFDIKPSWVTKRWARVSSSLAELGLEGYRVPVVTGSDVTDLAGSLTYYFDKQNQIQRVVFVGNTGDPTRLVDFVSSEYRMTQRPSLNTGLYIHSRGGIPVNALTIKQNSVITADNPHGTYQVYLELNRVKLGAQLSPQYQDVLTAAKSLGR